MTARIQIRRDTAANWVAQNPTLASGEWGFETDYHGAKLGDGATAWNSLVYTVNGDNAWSTYTPTLAQGVSTNIAKTVTRARYTRIGRTVTGAVHLVPSASGSAGSIITITAPIAAPSAGPIVGSGFYNDGGTQYQAVAYLATTGTIALLRTDLADASTSGGIGLYPNIAVAASDIIAVSFTYEAA